MIADTSDVRRNEEEDIRRMVIEAMGRLRDCGEADPDVFSALGQNLQEGNAGVRQSAVWALGEIGQHTALPSQTVSYLIDVIVNDEDRVVRRTAVRTLGKQKNHVAPHPEFLSILLGYIAEDALSAIRSTGNSTEGSRETAPVMSALPAAPPEEYEQRSYPNSVKQRSGRWGNWAHTRLRILGRSPF